jgi:molybdate transport system substrate-binding protein
VRTARALAVLLAAALSLTATVAAQRRVHGDLLVAAAASLSGLAPELSRAFHEANGLDVRFNFGGSNTLARQIVEGARVDVFISADPLQMDVVDHAGRLVPGTRVDIVSNQLVIVVPATDSAVIKSPDDLGRSDVRRVAMGDPAAVPAGVYGRRWLETVRLWGAVEPKVVPLPSSPAALAAVREGRADAAVVYATDAKGQAGVRVAHVVAPEDSPPIVYPAAAITGGRQPYAKTFLAFLRSDVARRVFENAGFRLLANR